MPLDAYLKRLVTQCEDVADHATTVTTGPHAGDWHHLPAGVFIAARALANFALLESELAAARHGVRS